MIWLECNKCGVEVHCGDETSSVICGLCVQRRLMKLDAREADRLGAYDPAMSKAARKVAGYSQSDLALHLRISPGKVGAFERESGQIDPKHAEWLDEMQPQIAPALGKS